MMARTPTCSSCGAPVRWARTSSGKAIPLDAEPDPAGNLLVVDQRGQVVPASVARSAVTRGLAHVQVARRGPRSIDPELPHWRSHFATCAHADRHRTRTVTPERLSKAQETLPL